MPALHGQADTPFRRAIVAIDDERDDLRAVAAAVAVAPTAELHLLTVFDGDGAPTGDDHPGLSHLRHAREHAARSDATIEAIHDSSASKGVKRHARRLDADLIVLGSSGGAPIGRTAMGTVSRAVMHGASCPVLLVPSGAAPVVTPRAIGLAFDGSPEATGALACASAIARATDGHLELVEIVDVHQLETGAPDDAAERVARRVHDEDERLAFWARDADVPATAHAEPGSSDLLLPDLAARSDLLVCGSRSWGMPGRTSLGTTADRIVRDSSCPVLVVPRPTTPTVGNAASARLRFVGTAR